jgi:EAL domain-containing protein (putative c-di-GMP-specific phosphodiesterase class I)
VALPELLLLLRKARNSMTAQVSFKHLKKSVPPLDQLTLFFQPQYRLEDMSLVGYEGLLRVFQGDQVRGPDFLSHLVSSKDWECLWGRVLNLVQPTVAGLDKSMKIALNTNPVQFGSRAIVSALERLSRRGVDLKQIEVEVTEEVTLRNFLQARAVIADIRALGISVVLDDFGSGYSSLRYLDRLDIDGIKLDRSLICGVDAGNVKKTIVKSVVEIGLAKNAFVLAEGIETLSELDTVKELGCCYGQGYFLGKPRAMK